MSTRRSVSCPPCHMESADRLRGVASRHAPSLPCGQDDPSEPTNCRLSGHQSEPEENMSHRCRDRMHVGALRSPSEAPSGTKDPTNHVTKERSQQAAEWRHPSNPYPFSGCLRLHGHPATQYATAYCSARTASGDTRLTGITRRNSM